MHVRVNVVQQRLAEHIQVARLHCIMGYVKNEEVNGRLGWPQLGRSEKIHATLEGRSFMRFSRHTWKPVQSSQSRACNTQERTSESPKHKTSLFTTNISTPHASLTTKQKRFCQLDSCAPLFFGFFQFSLKQHYLRSVNTLLTTTTHVCKFGIL